MLSPVLLQNPKTPPHHSCSQKAPLAQNTSKNRIQSHITHMQHTSILPTLILTSVVHHPTTSFNPILIHSTRSSSCLTLSRPRVTSHLMFSNRAISITAPRLWNDLPPELRTISSPPPPSLPITRHHLHLPPLSVTPRTFHS